MKNLKGREERYKHKITPRRAIEKVIEELSEKPLCDPPSQNRFTRE